MQDVCGPDSKGNVWYNNWHAPQIGYLDPRTGVIKEYTLPALTDGRQNRGTHACRVDTKRGYVWIRIVWQTGSTSEHWLQRTVHGYAQHADPDRLRQRVIELNAQQRMDWEIAYILNAEGFRTAHGPPFSGGMVHQLRQRWQIATVKINGKSANPPQWPDGTYSVQGAAAAIGITPQIIFDWLRRGRLTGKQLAKGMPWQIMLTPEQAIELRATVRRTKRSKREAS